MNVVTVIAARSGSTRLPGKVLRDIGGKTMLERVVERAIEIGPPVVITIPEFDRDMRVFCERFGHVFDGPEEDLLTRHLRASEGYEHVIRVTSDCPFLDVEAARYTLADHLHYKADLTLYHAEGRSVQVYKRTLLEDMDEELEPAPNPCREHLDIWPLSYMGKPFTAVHEVSFSVDTHDDLQDARRRVSMATHGKHKKGSKKAPKVVYGK